MVALRRGFGKIPDSDEFLRTRNSAFKRDPPQQRKQKKETLCSKKTPNIFTVYHKSINVRFVLKMI